MRRREYGQGRGVKRVSRWALLVIDMLNDFVTAGGALNCGPAAGAVIPAVAAQVERARRAGAPVIFACDRHRKDDSEFQMFPPHCIEGTPGAEVCAGLERQPGDVIVPKRRFSAFYGTALDHDLRELGVDELVLVGVCTNICVLYTASDARMRNYRVTVPRDAVATFDPEAGAWALRQMEKVLGVNVTGG